MYYGEIKKCDIANGVGVRVSLFVSGCLNHCPNCFNQITWDFEYGKVFDEYTENEIVELLKPSHIAGLTILGGEPLEPRNQGGVLQLIKKVKKEVPNKTIWIYSGFTLEELLGKQESRAYTDNSLKILENIDVLVDGRFIEKLKDITLHFRGSSNQRIIDVPQTLKNNEIILLNV